MNKATNKTNVSSNKTLKRTSITSENAASNIFQNDQDIHTKESTSESRTKLNEQPNVVKTLLIDHSGVTPPSEMFKAPSISNKRRKIQNSPNEARKKSNPPKHDTDMVEQKGKNSRNDLNWSDEFLTEPNIPQDH